MNNPAERVARIQDSLSNIAGRLRKRGVQRGYAPSDGGLGDTPRNNFPPFLASEGGREMVEKGFNKPTREKQQR